MDGVNYLKPEISVIVPVYNVEEFLEECINSILNQTYKNIEIILVDDESDDGSALICEKFTMFDNRIKFYRKTHGGLVKAREYGVERAKGKYIGFVDSDDWIDPDMYKRMLESVKKETDIVCCGLYVDRRDFNSIPQKNTLKAGIYSYKQLIQHVYPNLIFNTSKTEPGIIQSACTKLFKREKLQSCMKMLNSEITIGEDAAVVYPYILTSKEIVVLDECYYHYRIRDNSMCRSYDAKIFERITIFYAYMNEIINDYPADWNLKLQLKYYLLHFLHMGINNMFGIQYLPCYQPPYELITDCRRIILYGAGNVGKMYYQQLINQEGWEIVKWVDNKKSGQVSFQRQIESPDSIVNEDIDAVLLAIKDKKVAEDIRRLLKEKGIQESKILWREPFENALISFADLSV